MTVNTSLASVAFNSLAFRYLYGIGWCFVGRGRLLRQGHAVVTVGAEERVGVGQGQRQRQSAGALPPFGGVLWGFQEGH